jgi:C_GCAxxG_C_C family probable redox protein
LLAVSEAKYISNDAIPRIATGLCSGMARTGGMCGALSGAILAISLVAGRDAPDSSIEATYSQVRSLIASFMEKHGSTSCPELIECDLSTQEGQLVFKREHRILRCRRYVEDATRIVQDLL